MAEEVTVRNWVSPHDYNFGNSPRFSLKKLGFTALVSTDGVDRGFAANDLLSAEQVDSIRESVAMQDAVASVRDIDVLPWRLGLRLEDDEAFFEERLLDDRT